MDKDVPFSVGGSGPSATCGTGILSSISGGFEPQPCQGAQAFCVVSFPLIQRWICLPATGLAQGPQEGGSHRKINARSLPLVLYIEGKSCLNN